VLENEEYPASLELRKIYIALPDRVAGEHGCCASLTNPGKTTCFRKTTSSRSSFLCKPGAQSCGLGNQHRGYRRILAIDFPAVSDAEDQYDQPVIFDLADEPVVTHAISPVQIVSPLRGS
jgi:hypothetical protein